MVVTRTNGSVRSPRRESWGGRASGWAQTHRFVRVVPGFCRERRRSAKEGPGAIAQFSRRRLSAASAWSARRGAPRDRSRPRTPLLTPRSAADAATATRCRHRHRIQRPTSICGVVREPRDRESKAHRFTAPPTRQLLLATVRHSSFAHVLTETCPTCSRSTAGRRRQNTVSPASTRKMCRGCGC